MQTRLAFLTLGLLVVTAAVVYVAVTTTSPSTPRAPNPDPSTLRPRSVTISRQHHERGPASGEQGAYLFYSRV
ncbi:MAG: hypothetical protein ACRDGM_01270 [bacterium]